MPAGCSPQALYIGNYAGLRSSRTRPTWARCWPNARAGRASKPHRRSRRRLRRRRPCAWATWRLPSGMVDVALVVGVEKYTDASRPAVGGRRGPVRRLRLRGGAGLTPAAQAALLMQRYMHEYGVPRAAFAGFPLLAHANGASNPNAMFRKAISREAYDSAGVLRRPAQPVRHGPYADGAAALHPDPPEACCPPIFPTRWCASPAPAWSSTPWRCTTAPTRWLSRPPASRWSAPAARPASCRRTWTSSSCTTPSRSTPSLTLEAAGFAQPGEGWKLAQEGKLALSGKLPITTMGGLKARGNPVGATGVYQAVEAALQLRGKAGQEPGPRRPARPGPIPGRPGLHRRHPCAGANLIGIESLLHLN